MAEENKAEGGAEEAKPKKKLNPLLLGLGLQTVLLLVGAGLFVKGTLFAPKPKLTVQSFQERAIASVEDDLSKVQNVDLDPISVTMPGKNLIKTKLSLEVSNAETASLIKLRLPEVTSTINTVLSRQNLLELNTLQGKLEFKDTLRDALNDVLSKQAKHPGIVRDVYVLEFMQTSS
jgi:flagellar basal body-associated protein FliL